MLAWCHMQVTYTNRWVVERPLKSSNCMSCTENCLRFGPISNDQPVILAICSELELAKRVSGRPASRSSWRQRSGCLHQGHALKNTSMSPTWYEKNHIYTQSAAVQGTVQRTASHYNEIICEFWMSVGVEPFERLIEVKIGEWKKMVLINIDHLRFLTKPFSPICVRLQIFYRHFLLL